MTRILYWNIQQFSLNKIMNPKLIQYSADRLNHIIQSVIRPVDPHIISVVEVQAGGMNVVDGLPIASVGAQSAVILLLSHLRNLDANWCLIPPVNVGGHGLGFQQDRIREGVAVYYRADLVRFTGPYVFSNNGGMDRSQSPADLGVIAGLTNYQFPYRQMIIQRRRVGINAFTQQAGQRWVAFPNNQRVYERQFAGQYVYYVPPNPVPNQPPPALPLSSVGRNRINFPNQMNRPPYLTSFIEIATGRRIKLFSIHTSPGFAAAAVQQLQHVPEIIRTDPNEVSVVLGDFNVDSFTNLGAYAGLTGAPLNYNMHLSPLDVGGAVSQARKPYCCTHITSTFSSRPFNNTGGITDATHNVYPRFGYMSDVSAIDNVFTRYGANLQRLQNDRLTIVNTLTGKPYNGVVAPATVTNELTRGINIMSSLANQNSLNSPVGYSDNAAGQLRIPHFHRWANYAQVRSTSDHLAISIDV